MLNVSKNQWAGRRCFVVASGPSIKEMNLSLLKDEVVICVNESFKALDFDPHYICIGDRELWPRIKNIYAKKNSHIICGGGLNGKVGTEYEGDNLRVVIPLNKTESIDRDGFSFDLANQPLRKGWNVIPEVVLPFVCWAGFSDCYLLGCDCTNAGYFYNDPARGDGHQKFEDKTMGCYKTISETPDLPTRIWNAGKGGNLEYFPRVHFEGLFAEGSPIKPRDLLVVGYYTPDRNYKELAEGMKRSVEAQGLECKIAERASIPATNLPKPMPWVLNCAQCASFISDMLGEYPDRHILYLDADATMERRPELFLDHPITFDFAVPFLDNAYVKNELQSNTLFFAPTKQARELVERWASLQTERNSRMIQGHFQAPYREAWDQKVLQDVLGEVPGLRWIKLPWEYGKLDKTKNGVELMEGVDMDKVVISQHQASRVNKMHV